MAALLGQLHGNIAEAALCTVFGRQVRGHHHFEDMAQDVWMGVLRSAHNWDEKKANGQAFPQFAFHNACHYSHIAMRNTRHLRGKNTDNGAIRLEYLEDLGAMATRDGAIALSVGSGEMAPRTPEALRVEGGQEQACDVRDGERMWREAEEILTNKGKGGARRGGKWLLRWRFREETQAVLAQEDGTTRQNVEQRIRAIEPRFEAWMARKRSEALGLPPEPLPPPKLRQSARRALTDAQVQLVRRRRAEGATVVALAEAYGVNRKTIARLFRPRADRARRAA